MAASLEAEAARAGYRLTLLPDADEAAPLVARCRIRARIGAARRAARL